MSKKQFLKLIRGFCITQFILVMLYVMINGISKSEMPIILISAIFGLVCDAFCHTMITASTLNQEKQELDIELDQLMDEFNKTNKDTRH